MLVVFLPRMWSLQRQESLMGSTVATIVKLPSYVLVWWKLFSFAGYSTQVNNIHPPLWPNNLLLLAYIFVFSCFSKMHEKCYALLLLWSMLDIIRMALGVKIYESFSTQIKISSLVIYHVYIGLTHQFAKGSEEIIERLNLTLKSPTTNCIILN